MNKDSDEPFSHLVLSTFNLNIINKNKIFSEHNIIKNNNSENNNRTILECPICLSSFIEPCFLYKCKHIFCFRCIRTWRQKSNFCPLCRRKISKIKKFK